MRPKCEDSPGPGHSFVSRPPPRMQLFNESAPFSDHVVGVHRARAFLGLKVTSNTPQIGCIVLEVKEDGPLGGQLVRVGDRILSVNGMCGGTDTMLELLRREEVFQLRVRRPDELNVKVSKPKGQGAGFHVLCQKDNNFLVITGFEPGAMQDLNCDSDIPKVLTLDCIVAVNGVRGGAAKLLDEITNA